MEASDQSTARTCATHGVYQAQTVEIMGRRITRSCPACISDAEKHQTEADRRQTDQAQRARIEARFHRSGIPLRFQSRTFATYSATSEGQERALGISQAYASKWEENKRKGVCMIFAGSPGTGKTHLGCAIANAVIEMGTSSALFVTVTDALRSIKRAYSKDAGTSETEAVNTLVEPSLLILDEVGADVGTEHAKMLLFDVLNKRYENLRCTIILTNLDTAALAEYLGERIMDRLREGGGKLVSFAWGSHRA